MYFLDQEYKMSTDIHVLTCYNYTYRKINKPNKDYLHAKCAKEYNHNILRSGNLTNILIYFSTCL